MPAGRPYYRPDQNAPPPTPKITWVDEEVDRLLTQHPGQLGIAMSLSFLLGINTVLIRLADGHQHLGDGVGASINRRAKELHSRLIQLSQENQQ